MKKSTLAIGIIAVLGIGYVGTSWYTGNVIENNFDNYIAEITKNFNNSQEMFNVVITHNQPEKGLFSTKMHVNVMLTSLDDGSSVKLYDDNITIHHGPFPVAALSKGTFLPQMAWVEFEPTEQTSPEVWKIAGNKPFYKGHLGITYGEFLTLQLVSSAINLSSDVIPAIPSGNSLAFSSGEITVKGNSDLSDLQVNTKLDDLDVTISDSNGKNNIKVDGWSLSIQPENHQNFLFEFKVDEVKVTAFNSIPLLKIHNFTQKGTFNLLEKHQDVTASIDKIEVDPRPLTMGQIANFSISDLQLKQKTQIDDKERVNGSLLLKVGSSTYGKQNLGDLTFDFSVKNLSKEFDRNRYSTAIGSEITVNEISLHNEAGVAKISGLFKAADEVDEEDLDINNILNWDTVKGQLEIPFSVIALVKTQIESPNDEKISQNKVDMNRMQVATMAKMAFADNPMFKVDDNGISSNISIIKDQEYKLNGKTFTKEELEALTSQ